MEMSSTAASQCMISIEKKKDFCSHPPAGWRLDPQTGKMKCEDDSVLVLVNDKRFEGRHTYAEVETVEGLNVVKQLMMSKPIVTTAECKKPYYYDTTERNSDGGRRQSLAYLEDEYVVIINTQHPQIASQLEEAFTRAEKYLRDGNNFRVTIAFSESLKVYYMNNVHHSKESNSGTMAYGCDIHLTHGAGNPNCADRCFTCETAPMKAMWCVCFPCCLLTGVPYLAYKKFVKGLKEDSIKQPIPVTYHQGPFQIGFNLLGLLWPPNTTITTVTQYPTGQPYAGAAAPYTQQPMAYGQPSPQGYQQPMGYGQPNAQGYQQQPPPMGYQPYQPPGYGAAQ